jgi:large subunit ribosomal protein L25
VKVSGAIVSHVITELAIICLPKDLPEFIEVDLSELDTGHSLHVSGVKLPSGVTAVSHGTLDPVVATAVVPKAIVETEEEVAAAAEGAEAVPGEATPVAPGAEAKPTEAKAEKGIDKKDAGKDDKKK